MDFHLGAADSERTPGEDVSAAGLAIGRFDTFDAERGNGVQVDQRREGGQALPDRSGQESAPAAPAAMTTLASLRLGGQVVCRRPVRRRSRRSRSPERGNRPALAARSRLRDPTATLAPEPAQQPGGPLADRAGGREHGCGNALERAARAFERREHGGRGGGIGPVGVKEHGYLERAEERFLDGFEHGFSGRDVRAADEDGGRAKLVRARA